MASVTVDGATGSGSYIVVNYDQANYAALAQSLLAAQPGYSGYLIESTSGVIPSGTEVTGIGTTSGAGLGTAYVVDNSVATGQVILDGNGTSMLLYANGGGGSVITGSGSDTISIAAGSWDIVAGVNDQIFLGTSGQDTVATGGANVVVATGTDTVFGSSAGGASVYGGAGGSLTYVGGSGTATVEAGTGNLLAYGGAGAIDFNMTSGNGTITGGLGANDTINGGNFSLVTYFGVAGSALMFTGGGNNNLFIAGAGNETLNAAGSTGSNVFFAGGGNDSITGGSTGTNVLVGGTGNSTLTGGGAGSNVFAFVNQTGGSTSQDTITDWNSTDYLQLDGGVTVSAQDTSSGNLVMTLSDNTQITFQGVTSDISASQITYG